MTVVKYNMQTKVLSRSDNENYAYEQRLKGNMQKNELFHSEYEHI